MGLARTDGNEGLKAPLCAKVQSLKMLIIMY